MYTDKITDEERFHGLAASTQEAIDNIMFLQEG